MFLKDLAKSENFPQEYAAYPQRRDERLGALLRHDRPCATQPFRSHAGGIRAAPTNRRPLPSGSHAASGPIGPRQAAATLLSNAMDQRDADLAIPRKGNPE
jgi:hypothetical protein